MGNTQRKEIEVQAPDTQVDNEKLDRIKTPLDKKELFAVDELMEEIRKQSVYNAEQHDIPLQPTDNSNFPYNYERLELPLDEEGFCQAFNYDETEKIEKFIEKYGIVVIKDVLTKEECKLTEEEIWDFIERHYPSIKRDDVVKWRCWPALKHLGILDNLLVLSPQFFRNRQNEKIYHVFKHILKTDNLRSLIMRASAMRPTYNVPWPTSKLHLLPSESVILSPIPNLLDDNNNNNNNDDNNNINNNNNETILSGVDNGDKEKGKKENNNNNKNDNNNNNKDNNNNDKMKEGEEGITYVEIGSWRTISEWLHLDMNPFTGATTTFASKLLIPEQNRNYYDDNFRIQSILTAVDCGPNEGGFHCVPGFHSHIRGWANKNKNLFDNRNRNTTINIPEGDPIRNDIQKVPLRKGSLMIWKTSIPHGTFPNHSDKMRMVQYIQFVNRDDRSMGPLLTNPNYLPPPDQFQLTPLGSLLLDFPLL